jgi:tetratricopeptide (TPR) repeat protein
MLRVLMTVVLFPFLFSACSDTQQKTEEQFFVEEEKSDKDQSLIEKLGDSLKKDPDNISLWIQRGELCKEELNFACALDAGAKAFVLDSTNIEARKLYAWTLINKPNTPLIDIERAKRHYKYILSVTPEDPAAMVELANTYSLTGDFKTAIKFINDALRIDENYRDAYVLKGSVYKTVGNFDLALSSYQTAVQLDPDYFIGHLNTGWLLTDMKNHKLALEYYENAHELKPENLNAQYGIAKSYQDMGEFDKALAEYNILEDLDSSFYITYFNQGYIKQYHQAELDSAVYYYNKLLEINPGYIHAWYQLGKTYFEQGRTSDAARAYSEALKIDKEYVPAKEAAEELRKSL